MRVYLLRLSFLLIFPLAAQGAVDFDTLTPNTWAPIPTIGQSPVWAVETHIAFDTSGYAYMIGSCSYGGGAGGTHNNDIFKWNVKTGESVKLYTCGTNPWPGGCQAGQVFDPSRNCIWFGPGSNAKCQTNGVLWFPGQAYYGGLYRMWLPDGRLEKVRDNGLHGHYYLFDQANDLVIGITDNSYSGAKLTIYDIKNDSIYTKTSPYRDATGQWKVPCCFDTKRGLVVMGRWTMRDSSAGTGDMWFYNTSMQTWHKKTPVVVPPPVNVDLVYEPVQDKYVLFGTTWSGFKGTEDWHPQVWVYDYDSNTWTERPRGSLQYDTLDRAASTWPPLRKYPGSTGYCAKNDIIANFGGLPTTPNDQCKEYNKYKHDIWTFKLGDPAPVSISIAPLKRPEPSISAIPNPFNPSTRISFSFNSLSVEKPDLRVYDCEGRLIKRLAPSPSMAGTAQHEFVWDGRDRNGNAIASGVYFAKTADPRNSGTLRLVLMR